MAHYKGGWVEEENVGQKFIHSSRWHRTWIKDLDVQTSVHFLQLQHFHVVTHVNSGEKERERFLDFTACQPHMVTPGQETEGGRGKDQFTKQQHTYSKALCISVSFSLSPSLTTLPQWIKNHKHVNMLIKYIYIYLTLTTIFVGLFVCSQDYLWMTLLEQKGAVEWSGSWQTQWEKWCFHMYTLTGLWEQNGLIHSLGCLPHHLSAVKLLQRTRMREGERRYNIFIILGCYISHACRPCSCMRVETERSQSL